MTVFEALVTLLVSLVLVGLVWLSVTFWPIGVLMLAILGVCAVAGFVAWQTGDV